MVNGKWLLLILILFCSFGSCEILKTYPETFLVNASDSGDIITGNIIVTGEAVNSNVSMAIAVVNFPALSIVSPRNETYIWNRVFLDYLVGYSSYLWYNVDNGLNASISFPTELFLSAGGHVINLYAQNVYGVSHEDVWFSIDPFLLEIRYNNYKGSSGGGSSDFNDYSFEELQNLSDVVLEQIAFGKIEFNGVINVVNDSNNSDGVVDLDANVKMAKGFVGVNLSSLPNFNVSSRIYFYDLGMIAPRLLKDGAVCSPEICMNKSYVGGVLTFVALESGSFLVQESYVAPVSDGGSSSGGGGGGGGGGSFSTSSYDGVDRGILVVDYEKMSVSVRQGEIKTREILLKNEGDAVLSVEVLSSGLEGLLILDDYRNIVLDPGETKSVYIDISVGENVSVDNYLGKLFFRGNGVSKEVLLSVFVESMHGLFDVDVEIVQGGEIVAPGDYLVVEVNIVNLGEPKRRNVVISYFLKGEDGEVLFLEDEAGIIDTQLVLPKTFRVPLDFEDGNYILYVNVKHEERVTGGSVWFEVSSGGISDGFWFWLILIILVILFFALGRRKRKGI